MTELQIKQFEKLLGEPREGWTEDMKRMMEEIVYPSSVFWAEYKKALAHLMREHKATKS